MRSLAAEATYLKQQGMPYQSRIFKDHNYIVYTDTSLKYEAFQETGKPLHR